MFTCLGLIAILIVWILGGLIGMHLIKLCHGSRPTEAWVFMIFGPILIAPMYMMYENYKARGVLPAITKKNKIKE